MFLPELGTDTFANWAMDRRIDENGDWRIDANCHGLPQVGALWAGVKRLVQHWMAICTVSIPSLT